MLGPRQCGLSIDHIRGLGVPAVVAVLHEPQCFARLLDRGPGLHHALPRVLNVGKSDMHFKRDRVADLLRFRGRSAKIGLSDAKRPVAPTALIQIPLHEDAGVQHDRVLHVVAFDH